MPQDTRVVAESLPTLLSEHKHSVAYLRQVAESHFPDLKAKGALADGTKVDDIFYLRYILSSKSKETIESVETAQDSKALKDLSKAVQWRKAPKSYITSLPENRFQSLWEQIPILRTGELTESSFPVLYLPVYKVDLDGVIAQSKDATFQKELLEFLLKLKDEIFAETDKKTRVSGTLVKSVMVYDLKDMSYSSIFRLAKFFKMVQANGKIFKQMFPQGTHSTVIVNSPGQYVLKQLASGSSKQKVMGVSEFMREYGATNVVPTFSGGAFPWPQNMVDPSKKAVQVIGLSPIKAEIAAMEDERSLDYDLARSFSMRYDESVAGSKSKFNVGSDRRDILADIGSAGSSKIELRGMDSIKSPKVSKMNKKVVLTALEREMVHMKKNKLFSIDVLDKYQEINLFFSNFLTKDANILLVIKEKVEGRMVAGVEMKDMFSTFKNFAVINPGYGTLKLKMKNPGEVMLVYVDRHHVADSNLTMSAVQLENLDLKGNPIKRAYKYGKKVYNRRSVRRQHHNDIKLNLKHIKKNNRLHQMDLNGLDLIQELKHEGKDPSIGKVLFRFEVTDAIVCGRFGGEKSFSDESSEVRDEFNFSITDSVSVFGGKSRTTASSASASFVPKIKEDTRYKVNETGLIDFNDDSRSVVTQRTLDVNEPSFFRAVGQIFGLRS